MRITILTIVMHLIVRKQILILIITTFLITHRVVTHTLPYLKNTQTTIILTMTTLTQIPNLLYLTLNNSTPLEVSLMQCNSSLIMSMLTMQLT